MLLKISTSTLLVLCGLMTAAVLFPVTEQPAFNQQNIFYGLAFAASAAALLVSILSPKPLEWSRTDIWAVAFSIYNLLRAGAEGTQHPAHDSMLTIAGVSYFCFRCLFTEQDHSKQTLCVLFIGTGLAEAIWGLSQLYGFSPANHPLFRVTGSFFNPGPLAGYLAMVLPMALHQSLARYRSLTQRHFPVPEVTIICIMVLLPVTMSRSAWLAALAGSVWVLAARYEWIKKIRRGFLKHIRQYIMGICTLTLLGALSGAGMYFLKKPSADGRLLVWKITTRIIAEHPWFGVGPGHFSGAFGQAQADYFASGKGSETEAWVAGAPEYAFNESLQTGTEQGLIGLALFLLMSGAPLVKRRSDRDEGIKGSLVALLVFSCTSYPFSLLPFCIALMFLLALNATENIPRSTPTTNNYSILGKTNRAIFSASVLITLMAFLHQFPAQKAEKEWHIIQAHFPRLRAQKEDIEIYQKLYPQLGNQPQFLFEYGSILTNHGALRAANEIFLRALAFRGDPIFCNLLGKNYQALYQYDLSEYWLTKATNTVPNLLYPHYLLAKMYRASGQKDKALNKARYVIDKEPKVVSDATNEMKEEMQQLIKDIQNSQFGITTDALKLIAK